MKNATPTLVIRVQLNERHDNHRIIDISSQSVDHGDVYALAKILQVRVQQGLELNLQPYVQAPLSPIPAAKVREILIQPGLSW